MTNVNIIVYMLSRSFYYMFKQCHISLEKNLQGAIKVLILGKLYGISS